MSAVFSVPVEAVRGATDMAGAITMGKLAAIRASYEPVAIVELFEKGFVATLIYTLPGFPMRVHHAHVALTWAPIENKYRPPGPARIGEEPMLDVIARQERNDPTQGTAS